MPLLLVQSFVNTRDVGTGIDLLAEPAEARAWLSDAGLIGPRSRPGPAELAEAREVREALRALVEHNGGGPAPGDRALRPLRALARERRPQLEVEPGGRLELGGGPPGELRDGLTRLLVAVRDAQADGTWRRLKVCGNDECRWVFYDRSRNRRGAWCSMDVCGNRLKNRRFRARRHRS